MASNIVNLCGRKAWPGWRHRQRQSKKCRSVAIGCEESIEESEEKLAKINERK
jgi:hypothetical protein